MLDDTASLPDSATIGGAPDDLMAEVARLLVTTLNLDVDPATIDADAPLFGEGLGLDSIDILEIALEVSKQYGIQLRADDDDNVRTFKSLRGLADYVWRTRAA
jgi:acyl carrier protein